MKRVLSLVTAVTLAWLFAVPRVRAEEAEAFAPYAPTQTVSGTIRCWGHGFLRPMMALWEAEFMKRQPGVRFENRLVTSASAIGGLYAGRIDVGVLAREILPSEAAAYQKMTRQKLTPVTVLTGSYGSQDKIMALGIFVNRENPVSRLTFAQLDAIWGVECKRGAAQPLRSWGQLGLTGAWRDRLIQPYSGLAFEAPAYFFSQTVMKGSVLWNPNLQQFENVEDEDPSSGDEATAPVIHRHVDAYQQVVDAVGRNRYGIGLAGAGYRNPNVKLVALAVRDDGSFVEATKENVAAFIYPLARAVKFYINRGPEIPGDPKVIEFMRFILSREGQQLVAREGDFLPLTSAAARAQLAALR